MEGDKATWTMLTKDTVIEGLRPVEGKLMAFRTTYKSAPGYTKELYYINGVSFGHFKWNPHSWHFHLNRFLMPPGSSAYYAFNAISLGRRNSTLEIREPTTAEVAALRAAWESGEATQDGCYKRLGHTVNLWGWEIK